MDKISVIIPVYNVEKYLDECLESVVNQTYKNLEVILVDDGSTDKSIQICEKYANQDSRVKLYKKGNEGPGFARNFALEKLTGNYFTFIDSDDAISENYILTLYTSIKQNNADISLCDYSSENIDQDIIKNEEILNKMDLFEKMVKGNTLFSVCWGKLYNTDKYKHIKFNNFLVSEDELYLQNIYQETTKAVLCKTKLYFYRNNQNGIIKGKFTKEKLSAINALELREKFLKENEYLDLYYINRVSLLYKIIFLYFQSKKFLEEKERLNLRKKFDNYYKFDKKTISKKDRFWLGLFKFSPCLYNSVYKINRSLKCKKKSV